MTTLLSSVLSRLSPLPSSSLVVPSRGRSWWRYSDIPPLAAWPNKKAHLTHRRHQVGIPVVGHGVQKQTRLRCVDNSQIGREAMEEGRPPR